MAVEQAKVEQAKELLERLRTDAELSARLEEASNEERIKIVTEELGYDFTEEDFQAAVGELGLAELSDEDLEAVAGGSSATWFAAGGLMAAGCAAAAA